MSLTALLILADSRMPTGGHAHSGGIEQAWTDGIVRDESTLRSFLTRRLWISGLVTAALAAAATSEAARCRCGARGLDCLADFGVLDAEADARTPSAALREASRAQGRGLRRAGRAAWPHRAWNHVATRPHHPVAVGMCATAAALGPRDAASAMVYLTVTGSANAAQRLLSLDPLRVSALVAQLGPECDAVADEAVRDVPPRRLPAHSDPLFDLLAERHAQRKERLFVS